MTIHAQLTEQVQAKAGIDKPEPLVGNLSGYWSRRIDDTHRLVYEADDAAVLIIACRFHYND